MLIEVDPAAPTLLHEQLAASVRRAIAAGELKPGDRIPPARELAQDLQINVHTVLRGLRTLADEGLVDIRRGRGVRVRLSVQGPARIRRLARELAAEARRHGMSTNQAMTIVREELR